MEIPQEIDNYIKESIDHTMGLPVSTQTLQFKLLHSQESLQRVRNQCSLLLSKVKEKDQIIERARAEASMNAQAVKRFVEENQRLAEECKRLLSECNKLERECSLYDHDREALMDFGNEADERAKEAEIRVHDLEVELGKVLDELNFYKHHYESRGVDSSAEGATTEENLLESILTTLVTQDEIKSGHAFLEANREHESCQSLLKSWISLKPSTQKILSLAAEVKTLEKEKEHLKVNLDRAEEEVNLLFEQNKILDAENKRLLRQLHKERNLNSSGGKQTSSASAKTNKRKSSPKMSSPVEKKIDFDSAARQPLSPLKYNSPDTRMHKK
ncbi:Centlein like [Melia azedarach]|uniref:Centlein like n=1 Tax=Melia azedarach TaxID=155640 RepID=A0ACC1WQV3_MELAZ|nr:Centlein like [Melia azedarach]